MRENDSAAQTVRLVMDAQRGDVDAFACLVERHEDTLRRFCARLAGAVVRPMT